MPVHNDEMRNMQRYIADRLDATGEFLQIDTGYRFDNPAHPDVNKQSQRQIYARQRAEFSPLNRETGYLILTHADLSPITRDVFVNKLAFASRRGIHTANVMYKFLNDEGDFWRREVREDQRAENAAYRKQAAWWKRSLAHLPMETRNRLRKLTELERKWAYASAGNKVVLYQPDSARLNEGIVKFRLARVDRRDPEEGLVPMEEYRDPGEPVEELDSFTLQPLAGVNPYALVDRIDSATADKRRSRRMSRLTGMSPVLSADFVNYSGMDYARQRLVELRRLVNANADPEMIDGLIERLAICLENDEGDLSRQLDFMLQMHAGVQPHKEKTELIRERTAEEAVFMSRNVWNADYRASRTVDDVTGEVLDAMCSCPGFRARRTCTHIENFP